MLQDPEEFEDTSIVVSANSIEQARAIGEKNAESLSDDETIVKCIGCKLATKTTGKYICVLRVESTK
jgi:methylthioribose-1-phosphate isomerase